MTRNRTALTLTALGLAGALTLTACGDGAAPAAELPVAEAMALQAVGLETGLEQAAPAASAPADGNARAARKFLRKNTLHGEMTVQGKDGVRTIVVQRGTVTAVDATTLGVKSADGYAVTWTLAPKVRVTQDKKKVEASAVKVGAQVGVAGAKDGTTSTARLVAIG